MKLSIYNWKTLTWNLFPLIGKHLESRQSYQAKDFEFVTPGGRITPGLRCSTTNDGKIQLQEIVFCTDSNKRLKNCTANMCRMIPRQPRRRMCRMIPMPRHRMIPMPRQPRPGMCRMIPEPKWSATFIFPWVPTSLSGSSRSPPWWNAGNRIWEVPRKCWVFSFLKHLSIG